MTSKSKISFEEDTRFLKKPPGWSFRWGILLFASSLLLLIFFLSIIQYADKIPINLTLSSSDLPASVMPPRSGIISHIFKRENEEIELGEPLALLDNAAAYDDLQYLDTLLTMYHVQDDPLLLKPKRKLSLGTLQTTYNQLLEKDKALRNYFLGNATFQKIASLQQQQDDLSKLEEALKDQADVLVEITQLAKRDLNRLQTLLQEGVASVLEVERAEIKFLEYKQDEKNIRAQEIQQQVRRTQLQLEILGLREQLQLHSNEQIETLKGAYRNMFGAYNLWKQANLIRASQSGWLQYNRPLQEGQFVVEHEAIGSIQTQDKHGLVCFGYVRPSGFGKVMPGLPVNIEIDNYPFAQYGRVRGKVETIGDQQENGDYLLTISLPNPLVSTFDSTLHIQQQMPGSGQILTKKRSLLHRLLGSVSSAIEKLVESSS